jgi:hypothetical protein
MADAEGYRQDSGATTSDETLKSIIMNKGPLLNSPGELVPNTLYYDSHNCSVQAAELTNYFGRDRIQFNTKTWGSNPNVNIPNVFFTNTCFAVMELPTDAVWNSIDGGFYMPHGWGFHAIDNIVYYLGSSSVANIQISGVANFIYQLACCETESKKNAMITGAGKFLSTAAVSGVLSNIATPVIGKTLFRRQSAQEALYSGAAPQTSADADDPSLRLAVVPIRLPFSSMCALEKRISFDTKLLAQPIQVTLSIKGVDKMMQYTGLTANSLAQGLGNLTFQSFQQGLSDQSLSLRSELLANPRFNVGVPFQYVQDMSFIVPPSANGVYTVNITSMLNSDLTTIMLALRWAEDSNKDRRFAPLQFIKLRNFQLLLNGQRLHNYDNDSYEFVYLSNVMAKTNAVVTSSDVALATDWNNPAKRVYAQNNDTPIYEINFSRLRAVAMESHLMNTPRFTNQTMQIQFEIDMLPPNFPYTTTDLLKTNFSLQTSYYYNACFLVGGDGGNSRLITS